MKSDWDIESAIATYNVEGWGEGYFTVNSSGNVEARPLKSDGGSIDLLEVVNEARARNLSFPLLIRFQDLLRHRVESINRAFQSAISEFGYKNYYRGVFPIKVNQLREVVEEIVDAGEQFHFGLEAGSKPELVAALTPFAADAWLHCCAPGRWLDVARKAGFGGVSLDSRLIVLDDLAQWCDEARTVDLGVVRTDDAAPQGVDEVIRESLRVLRSIQVDLYPGIVLGTACGMAGWRQRDVMAQLETLTRAASLVEESMARG